MKPLCCAIAVVLMLAAGDTQAQQPPGTFTVYGAGTAGCASWTEHLKDSNVHARDLQWVFGFVSAAGVFAGVQLKADVNDIEPFMAKYCQENPQATINTAAATLIGKLRQ